MQIRSTCTQRIGENRMALDGLDQRKANVVMEPGNQKKLGTDCRIKKKDIDRRIKSGGQGLGQRLKLVKVNGHERASKTKISTDSKQQQQQRPSTQRGTSKPTDSAANLLSLGNEDVTLARFIHPLLAQLTPTPSPRGGCAQKALNVTEDRQGTCRHSRRGGRTGPEHKMVGDAGQP